MRKFSFLLFFLLSLLLSGCEINFNSVNNPDFNDFHYTDSVKIQVSDPESLMISLAACETKMEILTTAEGIIKLEYAYDDNHVKDDLAYSYSDGTLSVERNSMTDNCSGIRKMDSYIRLSLPRALGNVNINLNTHTAITELTDADYTLLSVKQENGNISVSGSAFNSLTLVTQNGNIDLKNTAATDGMIQTTNGNLTFSELDLTQFFGITVNGNVSLINSTASEKLTLLSTNGNITATDINEPDGVTSGTGTFKTVNGNVTLHHVYGFTVTAHTVNGKVTNT